MAKLIIENNDKVIEEMEIPPYEFKENEKLEKINGKWCLVTYPNTNDIKPITIQRGEPSPTNPVPIEHYINVCGIWYKKVIDEEELELLRGK